VKQTGEAIAKSKNNGTIDCFSLVAEGNKKVQIILPSAISSEAKRRRLHFNKSLLVIIPTTRPLRCTRTAKW
jgi:hypothetical protein